MKGNIFMKIVMLDIGTLGFDAVLSPLRNIGETVEYTRTSPEEVSERIKDADVVVVNKIKLGKNNLEGSKVRLICVSATGYDNIDTAYCSSHGIALCNVPGYSTESVAQLTLAMALSLATNLNPYGNFVHSGAYSESGVANKVSPVFHEISSLTWGIIGGGAIGTKVAEIAKAMGCNIIICRRKKETRYPQADIDTLCKTADIISVHTPLTEETKGLISRERITSMKKGAIFINVARGAVADEEALAEAIEKGHLGGLGVDVYSQEPFPKDHPFSRILNMDNVCLTPHMAWGAYEARNRCIEEMGKNISAFYAGEKRNRIV